MRRLLATVVFIGLAGTVGRTQVVVFDVAVTLRNSLTAAIKQYEVLLQIEQHRQLRRMARRLSELTNLGKYSVPDTPRWRTHDFTNAEAFPFAREYHAALNYGDPGGLAYLGVAQVLADPDPLIGRLPRAARRLLTSQLATLDLAGATVIQATNETGRLRFNGRQELRAIESLESDVTDGSSDQSTAAVLDKISGATLIGARQRQARMQFLSAIVEQLLVETKRERDTEASAMNMQLVSWRDRQHANDAFVLGASDALRAWRQP
jgi:hypothetical protein